MVDAADFLAFSANVFGVPAARLSLETTYGSMPEWDSMAHLRLVMEIASVYGVEIPFADVTNVRSLWEFLRRINGESVKKAIAVDLDNTLWEGVAGEDGVANLRPRAAFQRELKALKERGVLLVALSKNNPEDVGFLFDAAKGGERPAGMVLDAADFVTTRIDWQNKAENLAAVARELNLGTEAFVFVDDNPAERLEMSLRLPDVAVAEFPPHLEAYFPPREVTDEDRVKTEQYRAEAKRTTVIRGAEGQSLFDLLGVRLEVHAMEEGEGARVAQLSQKANQFNVLTNRRSEAEIRRLAAEGLVVTAHAGDRFGDQGLIAFVIVRGGEILDWVMSCRVMGRGLEERIERRVEELAAAQGADRLRARWVGTGRNAPVRDLFDRLGFTLTEATDSERKYERILR